MAKSSPTRRAGATVATTANGTSDLVFGVVFDLHGTPVPVSTADVANAVANGVEFTLPEPVDLGTLNDFVKWMHDTFGVDIPTAAQLPRPLDAIVGKLASLDFTVKQFHIAVPGTKTSYQTTQYTLAMQAMWAKGDGIPLIPGVLSIEGVFMGATNEKKPAANGG